MPSLNSKILIVFFLLQTIKLSNISAQSGTLGFSWVGEKESCNYPTTATALFTLDDSTLADTKSIIWNFGDGTGDSTQDPADITKPVSHTFKTPGAFSVNVHTIPKKGRQSTQAGGTFYIGSPDVPSVAISPTVSCNGQVTFTESSVNNGVTSDNIRYISWDFGDGGILSYSRNADTTSTVTHSYFTGKDSTYIVKMSIKNSCGTDSTISTIQIVDFKPSINYIQPACKNEGIQFSSTGGPFGASYNYLWDFGDSSTSASSSPTHDYTTVNTFTVSLAINITNGDSSCNHNIDTVVKILDSPTAAFGLTYTPACDTMTVLLSDSTTAGTINIASYLWDFGTGFNKDTSNLIDPGSFKYNKGGSYTISLSVKNDSGCITSVTKSVVVPSTPVAGFSATSVCEGSPATFTDNSTISSGLISNWSWNISDGFTSTSQNITHTFSTAGNFSVSFKVTSSGICSDSITEPLVISRRPKAAFTPDGTAGCPPLEVNFVNETVPDSAIAYQWEFGDGTLDMAKNKVHTYVNHSSNDTTYTVKLIATIGSCSSDTSAAIKIYAAPTASFTSDLNSKPNCGPDTVNFTSTSVPSSGVTYHWDFNDGTSSAQADVSHIFQNNNIYPLYFKIKLIVTTTSHLCPDTSAEQIITLYPKPQTDFLIDTVQFCPPAKFNFWAPPEDTALYAWDFGNGKRVTVNSTRYQTNLVNYGSDDTTFNVKLVSTTKFGCSDSTSENIIVPGRPKPSFLALPVTQTYPATSVSVTNNTIKNALWQYSWNYGDATGTSNVFSPATYNYQKWGKYNISFVVTNKNGCSDSSFQAIRIIAPSPILKISIDSSAGCSPLTVHFKDVSQYNDTTANTWDFGDGYYAVGTSPQHTFYQTGKLTVWFRTKDFNGNTDSLRTVITIYDQPSASFYVVPLNPEIPDDSVYCTPLHPDSIKGSETYNWNFGDGITSNLQRPSHLYSDTGKYYITLTVTSINNCTNSYTLPTPVEPVTGGAIFYPNAFMPNMSGSLGGKINPSDPSNKIFSPLGSSTKGVVGYHLEIYNSWGQLIFTSDDITFGWDGYYKGELCKQDVYVWKVTGVYSTGKRFAKVGNVTLFHSIK